MHIGKWFIIFNQLLVHLFFFHSGTELFAHILIPMSLYVYITDTNLNISQCLIQGCFRLVRDMAHAHRLLCL